MSVDVDSSWSHFVKVLIDAISQGPGRKPRRNSDREEGFKS